MSCSYSAQRKVLNVKVSLIAEIRRAGNQPVVSEPGKAQKFCDGDRPTVHNTGGRGGDDRGDACSCEPGATPGSPVPADAAGDVEGDDGHEVYAPIVAPGEIDGGPGDDRIFGGPPT